MNKRNQPISEKKFEQYCNENSIPFTPLSPGECKTPDYEIEICDERVIVEVKELRPNDDEQKAIHDMNETGSATWGETVGKRVRYKIDKAKRQIERLCANKCPGILLLYDARFNLVRSISPYEIEVGMYGFEAIDIYVPEIPIEEPRFGKHRFGNGKKLKRNSCKYISAIGVLRERSDDRLHLDIYHNHFADKPLPLAALVREKNMTVFTVAHGEGNEFRGWERVVAED